METPYLPALPSSRAAPTPDGLRAVAAGWVIRLADKAPPPEVRTAFAAWLEADPAHGEAFRAAAALWASPALAEAGRRLCPPPRRRLRPALRLAAAVALLLAGAQALGLPAMATDRLRLALADHATATGQRSALTLEDGSRVILDAASGINAAATAQGQSVTLLRGAAYFEVQPTGPGRAFTVSAGSVTVRVVGTAFAVRRAATATEIAVRQGTVAVWSPDRPETAPPLAVKAGEILRLRDDGSPSAPVPATDDAFAWLNGRLQFHDRPLGEVMETLERSLPGVVIIPDRALAGVRISGSYRLDDPEAVAASLAAAVSARAVRLGGRMLLIL